MITTKKLVKLFGHKAALDSLDCEIKEGSVYGLVGSNGSGKSTLMRLMSGVYYPDGGEITIDGQHVFDNNEVKDKVFFVPDELYFFNNASLNDMAVFHRGIRPSWSDEAYRSIASLFPIDPKAKLSTFSKGMQRQAAVILSLAARPKYLLLDEAFDGLDPVIRLLLRRLIADEVSKGDMTAIISSHNLRELEDLCDHVGLLHSGRILFEREIDELSLGISKIQAVFNQPLPDNLAGLKVLTRSVRGSFVTLVLRAGQDEALENLKQYNPVFIEPVSLTLEEVFIHEMEAVGYDYNNVIL